MAGMGRAGLTGDSNDPAGALAGSRHCRSEPINAIWIFGAVAHWFQWIPGVANTGEPNDHFVRDVGLVYGLFGGALIRVLRAPLQRHAVFVLAAPFYLGHALGHVAEILLGVLPPDHWLIDLPLVFFPGAVLGVLALPAMWRRVFGDG